MNMIIHKQTADGDFQLGENVPKCVFMNFFNFFFYNFKQHKESAMSSPQRL